MTRVPAVLLRHRVTIEPNLGDGAYGPAYGPPATVRALVADRPQMIRTPDSRTIQATATVIAGPEIECPVGSRVTLPDGRATTALTVARHAAPGLPVPACTEVMCQ
ncbi:hypothetical protein ACFU7T_25460 [Streptomyces sp. NPDC057555]|uniref:hypothetical protein n=1 Tax=Streptomyces sp. NPDC057555 TaxID=3346166 RepID=UPI003695CB96